MTKSSLRTSAAAVLSTLVLSAAVSSPVFAGFEWKGPLAPPAPPPAAASSAPVIKSDSAMGGLEPVITWDGAEPSMPAVKAQQVEQVSMPGVPAAPAENIPVADVPAGEVLEGFGDDLPLVIALQQVAPVGYQVSFGDGVSPGLMVSWQGGKPWQGVLSDMLAPYDLSYRVSDNTITVGHFAAPQEMPQAIAPQAQQSSATAPEILPPQDNASDRVLLGQASETGVKVEEDTAAETVTMRRDKPKTSSWLERLGLRRDDGEEVTTDMAPAEEVPAPAPAPATELTAPPSLEAGDITWSAQEEQVKAEEIEEVELVAEPAPQARPVISSAPVPSPAPAPRAPSSMVSPALAGLGLSPYAAQAQQAAAPAAPPVAQDHSSALALPPAALMAPSVGAAPEETGGAPVSLLDKSSEQDPIEWETPPPAAQEPPVVEDTVSPPSPDDAAAAFAAPQPAAAGPVWNGARGQTLRSVLTTWSEQAGVDLYWSIDYDYSLPADFSLSGTYDQAVGQILDKFSTIKPRPYGQLHQPDGGAKVLVIKSYDLAG